MEDIFLILEMIGVVAFAVSGAAAAIDKNTDIFGVMFLGLTTALGGGVFRDVMLGYLPPRMFEDYSYAAAAIIASLLVFAAARIWREGYFSHRDRIDAAVNVFDAIGLGVFTVSGMNLAIAHDGITNPLLVIVLGMATGIGGGMIRDVMIGEIPFVLRKRVYAVASLAGGCVYYLMYMWRLSSTASALTSIAVVFAIRMLATAFKWSLPKIR
jgi:uncharacterized membrane protein YeiH